MDRVAEPADGPERAILLGWPSTEGGPEWDFDVDASMVDARHNGHADLLRERIDGATGE